jgi:endonuclease/exonuclease/phosphatase family metal-dependent hydrolase
MRICCWNVKRASDSSAAWQLLEEISPDVALLQEVTAVPKNISDKYTVAMHLAAGKKWGTSQRFYTAILVRGKIESPIPLSSRWDWVNGELDHFRGNLLAYQVNVLGQVFRVMSVYSPAWPVDPERLREFDVNPIKLKQNPNVWVTELLWAALLDTCNSDQPPWVVAGDLNSSETFDHMWGSGPRGNREILDRMNDLGLRECLRQSQSTLVPTFRNPSNGQIVHQLDHLFVSAKLATHLTSCKTGERDRVFGESLSDHLPIIADFALPADAG